MIISLQRIIGISKKIMHLIHRGCAKRGLMVVEEVMHLLSRLVSSPKNSYSIKITSDQISLHLISLRVNLKKRSIVRKNIRILEDTFKSFNIDVRLGEPKCGSVTKYEVRSLLLEFVSHFKSSG